VAAAGLLDGAVTIDTYTDERCMRADVAALLPKVIFVQSPEIPASLDRMWIEITVELANGEQVKGRCTKLKGAWGEPLSDDEHLVKVRDCLRREFDDATVESCIATVQRFEKVDSSQVRGLMRTLGNFGAR
jgi:aconitate decarboxylase